MASQLPIFPVRTDPASAVRLTELGKTLFDIDDHRVEKADGRLVLRAGSRVVDVNAVSGGVWAADEAELWNPERTPQLVNEERARAMAEEVLSRSALLPDFGRAEPFRVDFTTTGRTVAATRVGKARPDVRTLDVQANFGVKVVLGGEEIPVAGGGGEFNVTLGDGGRVIGASGVWRPVEGRPLYSAMLDQDESDRTFHELTKNLKIDSFESFLAYYVAPTPSVQTMLYPVRVYRASAVFDDSLVPLRLMTLPATEYGPFPKPDRPQKPRPKRDRRLPKNGRDEGEVRPRRTLAGAAANPFEAGTSWIGESGGLSGSKNNAKGFVDGLAADGWLVNFNWGDENAWESDWRANDDTWVDNADFVFYTGHANKDGWVLATPNDTSLHFTEIGGSPGNPGDLWGQQDLEWVIVAACGPLQDDVLSPGGGSVLSRWDGAFDGLHTLMGYGAITYDNEDEGKSMVSYARSGTPLIDAWFRTAKEIQPSTNGEPTPDGPTVWVGAMYVYKSGTTSPRNDHLWGHGSVAADPVSPNVQVCIWTTC